jgi:hypothetical protein
MMDALPLYSWMSEDPLTRCNQDRFPTWESQVAAAYRTCTNLLTLVNGVQNEIHLWAVPKAVVTQIRESRCERVPESEDFAIQSQTCKRQHCTSCWLNFE